MAEPEPGAGEVVIEVEAAGLNFLDVLLALGALPDDAAGADEHGPRLGGECAGRIEAVGEGVNGHRPGQEVIALGARAFGSRMKAASALCAPKPAKLGWEQAATLPVAFLTAYHALEHVGRLRRGERVLIHAGAGGVGLAAIQWAKRVGAEIFATAGSEEKRGYLRELGVAHVLDSRSLGFADEIRRITAGEGIDVVLNSLSGEFIPASLGLLRDHGRFLEIGKRDYYDNKQLGLRPFLRSLSFSLVDLRGMIARRPELVGELLRELVAMFEAGELQPVPVRAFPASRAAEAFQHMAQAKHIGKIAFVMKDPEARLVAGGREAGIPVRGDRSYVITGGLGGLGLSVSRWLVERGARHLLLVGRRGPGEEAKRAMVAMEEAGASVLAVQADVSKADEVARIAAALDRGMPPLGGIVHAAGVLDDHTLLELSEESFRKVFAPKGLGAWNLHAMSEGREIDFFVMYSSAASLLGSPGQGNYAAANALVDALAHRRAQAGRPAMSIQWGAFGEVGLAAAQDNRGQRLVSRGVASLTPEEGLAALGRLFSHPRPEVGILRLDMRQWVEFYPRAAGLSFFAELAREGTGATRHAGEMVDRLEAAAPGERLPLLERHVTEQVGMVLRLDPARIDRRAPLSSLGLDSLLSLELRNRLEATLGLRLSATLLFTYPTSSLLSEHLLTLLGYGPEEERRPAGAGSEIEVGIDAQALGMLNEQETEALLEDKLASWEKFLE
jgi:NADPH:quinone reductase-like Zn-dependent oxidoreductase/NAD(P)-dependent dehydrogenase (short-subunit alcohol dehydrogenase family)/acyl carrier protein